LHIIVANNIHVSAVAFVLFILQCMLGGEERQRNVTYAFLKFLMAKMDPLNVVSHDVAVYKKESTTINQDLLCT
jgi:hypothetical protein